MASNRGPGGGAGRPPAPGRSRLVRAIVPVITFTFYLAAYAPLANLPGPDVPYYWLGIRHLEEGRWPWAGEPPLAFLLLWPLTRIAGDHLGFVLLAAASAALTVWLCGQLAVIAGRGAGGAPGGVGLEPDRTAVLAQALAAVYAAPHFVHCFLKNNLANPLMLAALVLWFGRSRRLAPLAALLALSAHPGAVLPLVAAIVLYWTWRAAGRAVGLRRRRGPTAGLATAAWSRRPNWTVVAGGMAGLALALSATGLLPLLSRYAVTYLRVGNLSGAPFANWDVTALLARYLPLWAALGVAAVRRVRRTGLSPEGPASPVGLGPAVGANHLMPLLWSWVFAQVSLAVMGGPAAARLDLQQFMPLAVLAASEPGSGLRWRSKAWATAALGLTLAFGLAVGSHGLHRRPMLQPGEVAAISALRLPPDSKVVFHGTDTPYWFEYLTGLPVLSPNLMPGRGRAPGPVYLLTEDPVRWGGHWPEPAMEQLRAGGRLVWESGRFMLIRASDDLEWFRTWPEQRDRSVLELLGLDRADWPVPSPLRFSPIPGQVLGWFLFAPTGALLRLGLLLPLAVPMGTALSYLQWGLVGRWAAQRAGPGGRSRGRGRLATSGPQHHGNRLP